MENIDKKYENWRKMAIFMKFANFLLVPVFKIFHQLL